MRDTELYRHLLGLQAPWKVARVELSAADGRVDVWVEPRLWALSAVLPIIQDTTIVAIGPTVKNVSLTGAVPVGIVGDAGKWVKVAP